MWSTFARGSLLLGLCGLLAAPVWAQGTILMEKEPPGRQFGLALARDGEHVAVGALDAAYLYTFQGGVLEGEQVVTPQAVNPRPFLVALDAGTAVINDGWESVTAAGNTRVTATAFVYEAGPGGWRHAETLRFVHEGPQSTTPSTHFSAVGVYEDVTVLAWQRHVLFYRHTGAGWQHEATLQLDEPVDRLVFEGEVLAVQEAHRPSISEPLHYRLRIFEAEGTGWRAAAAFDLGPDGYDDLAIHGRAILAGHAGARGPGWADAIEPVGDGWARVQRLEPPWEDRPFGTAVDLSDRYAVVASRYANAYVFERRGGRWEPATILGHEDIAHVDLEGRSLLATSLEQFSPPQHPGRLVELTLPFSVDAETPEEAGPGAPRLDAVFPSPFREAATVAFTLPHPMPATLTAYDATGRVVAVLFEGRGRAGRNEITWDAPGPSGVYYLRLGAGGTVRVVPAVRVR